MSLDPWAPFKSVEQFKLAQWFIRAKASQKASEKASDDYFRSTLNPQQYSFSSGRTVTGQLEQMHTTLRRASWQHSEIKLGGNKVPYFCRDPMRCLRHLLKQHAYKDCIFNAPTMAYAGSGDRMYGQMHTANW